MLRGSAWMVGLRWAIRLTGVVSTLILARLLTPADFGVVAIAMIVVGMLEMLSQTGQAGAIIRHENPTREHYDSAWTISVLIGFAIALAIVAAAPLTRIYFHDPRSIPVMQCLALRAALAGLENVGTVDFRRDFRFESFFGYNIYSKLIAFFITIPLAFFLRNYWALVAGILSGQLARTVLSYVMHPFRPRLSFREVSGIWSFSIWTFVRQIGNYFSGQLDHIAIGGVAGAAYMGRYTVATDLGSSPSTEIVLPVVSVFFPVMARLQNDPEELRRLYLRTLGWAAVICASTSVGVALIAPELVRFMLGARWTDIVPLIAWLAFAAGIGNVCLVAYATLDTIGLPHVGARMQWVRVAVLGTLVFPVAYLSRNLVAVAVTQFISMIIFVPSLLIAVGRRLEVSRSDYAVVLWRPLAAAGIMAAMVTWGNRLMPLTGNMKLCFDVLIGMLAFTGAILGLWLASGRPQSPERDIVSLVSGFWARPQQENS